MEIIQTTSIDKNKRFEVSIRIYHPSIDPAEITLELSWIPDFTYKVGESRRTPKGVLLKGKNKGSFWFVIVPSKGHLDVASTIGSANSRLLPSKEFLQGLADGGAKMEYFVGIFIDEFNISEVFDWHLLKQCGDLRMNLVLDLYGPEKKDDDTDLF